MVSFYGSGFRVLGLGFWVLGLGFRVPCYGFFLWFLKKVGLWACRTGLGAARASWLRLRFPLLLREQTSMI